MTTDWTYSNPYIWIMYRTWWSYSTIVLDFNNWSSLCLWIYHWNYHVVYPHIYNYTSFCFPPWNRSAFQDIEWYQEIKGDPYSSKRLWDVEREIKLLPIPVPTKVKVKPSWRGKLNSEVSGTKMISFLKKKKNRWKK